MMMTEPSSAPKTLSEIFLDILERNSNSQQRVMIAQVREAMNIPAYAELFNVVLINALDVRMPIAEDTVHRATECLISHNKADIERNLLMSTQQKDARTQLMVSWLKRCEQLLLDWLRYNGLLM